MPRQPGIRLSANQEKLLKKLLHDAADKREYRAALGILLRGEGKSAEYVAHKLGVTMKQVFMWCRKFRQGGTKALLVRKQTGRRAVEGNKAKKMC